MSGRDRKAVSKLAFSSSVTIQKGISLSGVKVITDCVTASASARVSGYKR